MSFDQKRFQELRELALSKRKCGRLTVEYELLSESKALEPTCIDDFLKRLGFTGSRADLHQIEPREAAQQATLVLNRDLAYGTEIMTPPEAKQISSAFLSCFERPNTQFFTNCWESGAGNPISESTFDQGVVALSDEAIGILWAQNED